MEADGSWVKQKTKESYFSCRDFFFLKKDFIQISPMAKMNYTQPKSSLQYKMDKMLKTKK